MYVNSKLQAQGCMLCHPDVNPASKVASGLAAVAMLGGEEPPAAAADERIDPTALRVASKVIGPIHGSDRPIAFRDRGLGSPTKPLV